MNRQPLWRPTTRRRETLIRWAPVLVIVAASLALGLGEDELRQWGRYDREALESGELWRLVTAHLVHLGWGHLWLNLAALVMMAVLFDGLMSASDWVLASALAALSIDIGLYLVSSGRRMVCRALGLASRHDDRRRVRTAAKCRVARLHPAPRHWQQTDLGTAGRTDTVLRIDVGWPGSRRGSSVRNDRRTADAADPPDRPTAQPAPVRYTLALADVWRQRWS